MGIKPYLWIDMLSKNLHYGSSSITGCSTETQKMTTCFTKFELPKKKPNLLLKFNFSWTNYAWSYRARERPPKKNWGKMAKKRPKVLKIALFLVFSLNYFSWDFFNNEL